MDDMDFGSLFLQPDNSDMFDLSSLFGGGNDWQPMDISGIDENPWLSMTTAPDSTGLGGLSDIFNLSGGGIANMTPDQYASLFGGIANAARPPGANSGYAGGGAPSGNSGGGLSSLLGNNGLASILPMLLAAGGGLLNRNATNDATQQVVQGLNNASDQAKQLIGGAQANYQPYMQAGTTALSKLANMDNSNIAGQFKPLGSGKYIRG